MLEDVLKMWNGYEVSPIEVYSDIFKLGEGYLQKENELPGMYKTNPLLYYRNNNETTGHYRILFEDTFEEVLAEGQDADFCILNGISYFGRRNLQSQASKMFAMIFDLDGVTDKTLNAFLSGSIDGDAYPLPQYIVLSGENVHLYYVFEKPIDLYPYINVQLKEIKYALTDRIWNKYTSKVEKVQHQGINQGFRIIGGKTKDGKRVRAFRMNEHPVWLDKLNEYIPEEHQIDADKLWKESKYQFRNFFTRHYSF